MRPAIVLPILLAVTGGLGAADQGDPAGTGRVAAAAAAMAGPRAPVAVRAPLSAEVLQAMARGRLSAEAAVADYWTTERMRVAGRPPGARPATSHRLRPAVMATVPPVSRPAGTPRSTSAEMGRAPRTGVVVSRTAGKVFFRNAANGRDYSCSAAVVRSPSKELISTAGHCVHDSHGTWHQNWIFVPSFDRGRRPYGIWPARWLATFIGWAVGNEPGLDVAFVKVAATDGRSLVDAVGGNRIRVGFASRTRRLTILGYPFLPPYPGDRQYSCQGVTRPAGQRLRMACPLTTGASGGPWLEGYDAATGQGYLDGVTTNTDLANTTLWSPYFDGGVGALYRWADRL